MKKLIDFKNVSTEGLETVTLPESLAGLRANEARYFDTKYKTPFYTFTADEYPKIIAQFNQLLQIERELEFSAPIIEISINYVENTAWIHFFYQNGMALNLLYPFDNPAKRAVGIKLSEGIEVPVELVERFKFARQKSKLAGTIRGTFFKVKGDYDAMVKGWLDNQK